MNTAEKVNQINVDFYDTISQSFSQTRQYAWNGWDRLKEKGYLDTTKSVLDLGCGNGRFAHFLANALKSSLVYRGIDSCEELLKYGEVQISEKKYLNLNYTFSKQNIFQFKEQSKYDLIILFGVMHHIYCDDDLINLFSSISKSLKPNGYYIFATWEFSTNDRQMKKRLNLESVEGEKFLDNYSLSLNDFQKDDYILDWTRINEAYRYCKAYSDETIEKLCKKNNLQIVEKFFADGKEGNVNKYYVCRLY